MSYTIRRSNERKFFDHGWLKTYHTFSFGNYYDPQFMGFKDLRVINEDRVDPGKGFPPHSHKDMEIISIVLEGELAHQDSTGTESVLKANEVQAMTAGTGVTHSEYNPSDSKIVHFLQIWILPDRRNLTPRYQQTSLPKVGSNHWLLIASKNGRDNSLLIHQDVELFALSLGQGAKENKKLPKNRCGWIQVIEGKLKFNQDTIQIGDGVAIDPDTDIHLEALSPSRLLFFDLKI